MSKNLPTWGGGGGQIKNMGLFDQLVLAITGPAATRKFLCYVNYKIELIRIWSGF